MPNTWADWLGVLGFLIAVATLAWEILSHFYERKELVRLSHTSIRGLTYPYGTIMVTITNVGRAAVYVKQVAIECTMRGHVIRVKGGSVQEAGGSFFLTRESGNPSPLNPGDSCRFHLPNELARGVGYFVRFHPRNLEITVRSARACIGRIPGEEFHKELVWMAQEIERQSPIPSQDRQGSVFGSSESRDSNGAIGA